MRCDGTLRRRLGDPLQRSWWRPRRGLLAQALRPLAWLYGRLWQVRRGAYAAGWLPSQPCGVPLIVVGNLVVGGAGKTPTVIALVQALRARGWQPGVISRGYGGRLEQATEVTPNTAAADAGDEPVLIRHLAGVPVVVARRRGHAAQHLRARHPEVDVIVADDGLQHLALQRDIEVIVFDARGAGNGLLLPAGPLREPLRAPPGRTPLLLYTAGVASTALPGFLAQRALADALPLAAWLGGSRAGAVPLSALHGRKLLAVAGVAQPSGFFDALRAAGLDIDALPLPDHAALDPLPWSTANAEVVLTEKDAVKLRCRDLGGARVWVVGLDFRLPDAFVQALFTRLGPPPSR